MKRVHKLHEIAGRAEPAVRCIRRAAVTRGRTEADRVKMHLLYIRRQRRLCFCKRGERGRVELVNGKRLVRTICGKIMRERKTRKTPDHGRSYRRRSLFERERIAPAMCFAGARLDLILVRVPLAGAGNKELENTGIAVAAHLGYASVPVIEVTDHADSCRVRRVDCKKRAVHTVALHGVRPEPAVDLIIRSGGKRFDILFEEQRGETVAVLLYRFRAVLFRQFKMIPQPLCLPVGQERCVKAVFIRKLHRNAFVIQNHGNAVDLGEKALNEDASLHVVRPQQKIRPVAVRIEDRLDSRPVHEFIQLFFHMLLFPLT